MTFPARIVTRGNGFYIPLLKQYVESMGLQENDDVDVTIRWPKGGEPEGRESED